MKKESEKELKHKARRRSIQGGIFTSAKTSLTDQFISPFAIAINTSSSMVALLSSISGLFGPLSQMFGSRLIEKEPRKKIILRSVLLESLFILPFIIIAILFYKGIVTSLLPLILLIFFAFYVIFLNLGAPAWFSWMGDIVDDNYRGRWFAKRNLLLGFISVVIAVSASFGLDYFKKNGMEMFGFMALFGLAFLCRMGSWRVFKKKYEPKIKVKKKDHFSFFDFITKAPKNNFGRFAIFRALIAFTGSISAPLMAVYFLRNLGFAYYTYIIVIFSSTVFSLLVIELWGKFADRYGNYKTLAITSIAIPTIPILLVLHPSPFYLIFVPFLVGGISWAGFNLAAGNFIYDNVSQEKRGLAVSYYNMLNGIGIALGAALGAFLIKAITTTAIEPIVLIFFIGSFARMIVVFFGIPKIREVKKKSKFEGKKALRNIILKEAKPTLMEEAHEIMSINRYFR